MIIVKLKGGLGNQLFQYASGRRLSIFHRTPIKLDIRTFDYHKLRHYSLGAFHIQEAFAAPHELAEALEEGEKRAGREKKPFLGLFKRRPKWSVFREDYLGPYNAGIMGAQVNVYLDGYWQSEKYFRDIQDLIRREFTIKFEQDSKSREIAEAIARSDSVSVHVRRADYVSDPATYHTHGACELEYYNKASRIIQAKIPSPRFFVFSDDPLWCEKNLRFNHPVTFITHNCGLREYEDLRLMSLCKHNIIANSSFSWWAAWLNANEDKMILAPRKWLKDKRYDTRDVIPENWIRV